MKAFMKEFKEFISKGNVMDLAVGVIIGGAFQAIVGSLVNDIIMPLLGIITGGLDFSHLAITVGEAQILYGGLSLVSQAEVPAGYECHPNSVPPSVPPDSVP